MCEKREDTFEVWHQAAHPASDRAERALWSVQTPAALGKNEGLLLPACFQNTFDPYPNWRKLVRASNSGLLLLRSSLAHPFRSSSTRLRTREVIHPISCQVLAVLSKPALGSLYRSKLCKFMH